MVKFLAQHYAALPKASNPLHGHGHQLFLQMLAPEHHVQMKWSHIMWSSNWTMV
jgi:hypothetical protein